MTNTSLENIDRVQLFRLQQAVECNNEFITANVKTTFTTGYDDAVEQSALALKITTTNKNNLQIEKLVIHSHGFFRQSGTVSIPLGRTADETVKFLVGLMQF